ncbi:MAG: ATP-dependent Clp protease proteolytic subunit [Paludibacteraceae bacterium]|nr:ATP-dependent Clp protease proteolytic subunit [Paludibacteraceae bacterium]
MPSWNQILARVQEPPQGIINIQKLDLIKNDYIAKLSSYRNRNLITYYSGWLYRQTQDTSINDKDINAFMAAIHGMDRSKGLDLVLHTPGGEITATEQIINYLHSCFNDVTVIVPHMAMSAGSLISVSCDQIIMGRQSCLGPFDPQSGGVACQSVLKEFEKAKADLKDNPQALGLWQVIVNKYPPTFIHSCEQAIELTEELANKILNKIVLQKENLDVIKKAFNDNTESKTHSRHFSIEKLKKLGLNVIALEDDQNLQELVLSLHHCYTILLENMPVVKCVESNAGGKFIVTQQMIPTPTIPRK